MKLLRKMVFDLIAPAPLGTIASSPRAVSDRFEPLNTRTLQRARRLVRYYTQKILRPLQKFSEAESIQPVRTLSLERPIPLIKASTSVIETAKTHFSGQSILCVGGQKKLYPAYRQIVEDAGGIFISFHGATDTPISYLRTLLKDADLIICPIDCICHEAFFVTQEYSKQSSKPCVILDKSRITTFYNGIRVLKNLQ